MDSEIKENVSKMQSSGQQIMGSNKNKLSDCTKGLVENASKTITNASGLKQFALGGASGWCTGFLSTRVGKTVALSVGGSVVLVAAAHQAGLVNVNWDRFGNKVEQMATKVEHKMPAIKTNVGRYAKTNHMFAAGFVGGFLLGLCS